MANLIITRKNWFVHGFIDNLYYSGYIYEDTDLKQMRMLLENTHNGNMFDYVVNSLETACEDFVTKFHENNNEQIADQLVIRLSGKND